MILKLQHQIAQPHKRLIQYKSIGTNKYERN
jgi:hypothetical protein